MGAEMNANSVGDWTVFVRGDQRPGFIVYALFEAGDSRSQRRGTVPPIGVDTIEGRLDGTGWVIETIDIAVDLWPMESEWAALSDGLLRGEVDRGAVVAWIDTEGCPFADPPGLFDASFMSGAVRQWRTRSGLAGVASTPYSEPAGAPTEVLALLHAEATQAWI
jgi:hypothetical protein